MHRLLLPVAAALLLAACGGGRTATSSSPAVPSASVSASAVASPSGPATPTAGESAAAFWQRRGVSPPPPADFLDGFSGLRLPSSPYVRGAVRELAGEAYAIDHLRLDLVDAGVLGSVGLSGDAASIDEAKAAGLAGTTTTLKAVLGSVLVDLPSSDAALGKQIVALRLQYGPFVGHYADGTSKTLGASGPESVALAGQLVTTPLLGTFFYVTSEVDCSSVVGGSISATACSELAKS